jgi:chemotaxis protein MotB
MNPRVHRSRVTHDRWLVSYADFITLLFALFVVMYAFARASQNRQQAASKQEAVSQSVDTAFRSLGIFPDASRKPSNATSAGSEKSAMPMNIVMGEDVLAPARVKQDLDRLRRELTQTLSDQVATHTVSIRMGRDGLVISLREAGFFDSGSAAPKPATLPTLRQIAAKLGGTPYDLCIEGHTDSIPIHNAAFDSNWELSTARATSIARLFVTQRLLAPARISAAGYAQYHPVAGNDTAEGRAENRRVDLTVLPRAKINFAASSSTQTSATEENGSWRRIDDGE